MGEALYLLLGLGVVVSYLLLTDGDRRPVRPRTGEIERAGREWGRELDGVGERYRRVIDEAEQNAPSRRRRWRSD